MKARRALLAAGTTVSSMNVDMTGLFLFLPLAEKQVTSAQLKEHRVVVLDLSESYLKSRFPSLFVNVRTRKV